MTTGRAGIPAYGRCYPREAASLLCFLALLLEDSASAEGYDAVFANHVFFNVVKSNRFNLPRM